MYPTNNKIQYYLQLMRVDKPIGTLLLLWPTLWALWLSGGEFGVNGWHFIAVNPHVVLVFLMGVFLMRSAGCVINDYADRDIDRYVERTQQRPLTAGHVSVMETLVLFTILVLLALLTVLTLSDEVRWAVLLTAIPALLIAITYPFTKRFFVTPQLVLGIAFSFGIPMSYFAHGKGIELGTVLLMLANICWVIAYDTAYAMVDRKDDEQLGVLSSARFFGVNDRKIIGLLQLATVILLALTGLRYSLNSYYFLLLLVATGFFVYQQWLIKDRQPEQCFIAFLNNSWVGGLIFLGILLGIQSI